MNKLLLALLFVIAVYSTSQCEKGMCLTNGRCTPIPYVEACVSYDTNGNCMNCQFGYKLSNYGLCQVSSQINKQECCTQRDVNNNCLKCADGLYLENNKCKRYTIDGCVVKSHSKCLACGNGYVLSNNACRKIIQGCASYDSTGACSKCSGSVLDSYNCSYSYTLSNGVCLKVKQPSENIVNPSTNCIQRNGYGCLFCDKGYYLTQDSQCQIYEVGCLFYFKGACKELAKGYSVDHKSGKVIKNIQITIPYCVQYSSASSGKICTGCAIGYRLSKGQCVDESSFKLQCRKQCAKGFTLTSDNRCKVAGGNLVKEPQNNDPSTSIIRQPGCIYQYGKCEYCDSPFVQVNGKCVIPNCLQFSRINSKKGQTYQCLSCVHPYQFDDSKNCIIPSCSKYISKKCVQCQVGYHLKGEKCIKDDINCLHYTDDGNCDKCADKYLISSNADCMLAEPNCNKQYTTKAGVQICIECVNGFFLNRFNQCQKVDVNCQTYVNGVCKTCKARYFIYDAICFPYTVGCVKYNGKACTECKKGYKLYNQECFNLDPLSMKLEGEDTNYDFDIYPVDIRKSKFNIENLSPFSELGDFICSSSFSGDYLNPLIDFQDEYYNNENRRSKGWKASTSEKGQYAGFKMHGNNNPVTFYSLQLEFIENYSIKTFYLEYSKDGVNWIRVENVFHVDQYLNSDSPQYLKDNGIVTVYFTGIYAQSIRIVIDQFVGWPACKIEFFYYDLIRFRKISNLKSLKFLTESIESNYVDRLDNQLYINQRYFFDPQADCHNGDQVACFTGLELCQVRSVPSITLVNQNQNNYVSEFYIMTSQNGRQFTCYNNCNKISVAPKDMKVQACGYSNYKINLGNLQAKNVRVYPSKWVGTPKLSVTFDYE